jgi:hypothetical protein
MLFDALRCVSARTLFPMTYCALPVTPKHADVTPSLFATERRLGLCENAVRKQEAGSKASLRYGLTFGLLCIQHKHKQPRWILASPTQHPASSCKNSTHWQYERSWKSTTHTRLDTSTPQALLDRSVAKKTCACGCADSAHRKKLYKQRRTATSHYCPSSRRRAIGNIDKNAANSQIEDEKQEDQVADKCLGLLFWNRVAVPGYGRLRFLNTVR